jgi:predicted dienelactone hydrolase
MAPSLLRPLLPALAGAVACGAPTTSAAPLPAASADAEVCEAVWTDADRERGVPVRIRLPAGDGPLPVVLFSHGLGGSLDAGTTWAEHWSAHGIATIHLQHPGSDASLLRGARSRGQALEALREGMGGRQLLDRVRDVGFILDRLEEGGTEGRCDLARLDLERVGMAGHSFGSRTTLAAVGQRFPAGSLELADPRIRAALALSPAPARGPGPVGDDEAAQEEAFGSIQVPVLFVTGTEDEVPELTDVTPEDRTRPFYAVPPGEAYLLVFEGADHSVFGGNEDRRTGRRGRARAGRRSRGVDPELAAHVSRSLQEISLAFWRSALLDDSQARQWLQEGGPGEELLRDEDRFEHR